MGKSNFSLWNIWVASTLLKCLLFPAYRSTDFEVHRNWMAITYHLPLKDWYIEDTSIWTLDYPPFFAYFEWILSHLVPQFVIDDNCLVISAEPPAFSWPSVFYQRSTVILSECVLFWALQWYINSSQPGTERSKNFVVASSIVLSPALTFIDHIHFQYNGMLFGILCLSLVNAQKKNYLACAVFYTILLCFKHIFLYLAPAYFAFLLRNYCLNIPKKVPRSFSSVCKIVNWLNCLKLGSSMALVVGIAFGPFAYYGVITPLVQRLFPFARGLTHAYWAPNVWAIYSFLDRVLIQFYRHVWKTPVESLASTTSGLVRVVDFTVLPNITPKVTFLLTLFYQIFAILPVLITPTFTKFVGSLTLCGFASFLFGWHVHEKAILLVIIPFTFIVPKDKRLFEVFKLLTCAGYVSLFPLLFRPAEYGFKTLYTFVWCVIYYASFEEITPSLPRRGFWNRFNLIYIIGLLPVVTIVSVLEMLSSTVPVLQRFEFVKLMIYSVYCSIGVIASWNSMSWLYYLDDEIWS
ncbi:unnamed protein product [Kuraishia capsulata CBS 1993]|uniref:Alpha-1,3-glucosyltransferase n=1 Tax=Kuraishia capsulata CBS 1993 TaxID=1382522 RepID=W6MI28_9ASCO|nr:uncharacterized protein KUCA_T00001468001 [Kuraishia capsulata CBS 1993]CDK25498.1 unnamed protein product [Kuraishia capsulata CBS 1993]